MILKSGDAMDNIERLKRATNNVNRILTEKLPKLLYFNDTNFNKNAPTFNRNLIYGEKLSPDGQMALYLAKINTLIIDESNLNDSISDEQLEIIILHECLHMASTDLEKQIIGLESEAMPITYNEALTQWLTLKLYYGQENIEEAIQKNRIYHDSVLTIHSLIKKIGEEHIYSGFFEADIKRNSKDIPKEYRSEWIDTILDLENSSEEAHSKVSIEKFDKNVTNILKQIKISTQRDESLDLDL